MLAVRGIADVAFAQPVSAVRRVAKRGARIRDPSPALRALQDHADLLGRRPLGGER